MRRLRTAATVLAALLATGAVVGAVVASVAQATSAPYWSINGTRLAAGQTHNVIGKAVTAVVLDTPVLGIEISCRSIKAKRFVLLGSSANNPGKDDVIYLYDGCTLLKGNGSPECKLVTEGDEESLTSNWRKTTQVERAAPPKILLDKFAPEKGALLILKFEGKGCEITEAEVTGQVAAEVVTDNAAEETIELGQPAKQATAWNLRFPTTPITQVISVTEGIAKEEKLELTMLGDSTVESGTVLISLANGNFEAEETNWSPLP